MGRWMLKSERQNSPPPTYRYLPDYSIHHNREPAAKTWPELPFQQMFFLYLRPGKTHKKQRLYHDFCSTVFLAMDQRRDSLFSFVSLF